MDKRLTFILLGITLFLIILNIDPIIKLALISLIFSLFSLKYFKEYIEDQELERNFPIFLRDLSQYIKIGQPLPIAVKSLMNNNYGKKLNQYIKYLHLQMEYGVPFNKALINLTRKINVKSVRQSLSILSSLLIRGSGTSELFESMSEMFYVSNSLKKERLSNVRYLAFSYYGLFILVILVIYAVYRFMYFIPLGNSVEVMNAYKQVSSVFILLNALFTGLVIGKVSEGKIVAGVVHSIFLLVVSTIFILVF